MSLSVVVPPPSLRVFCNCKAQDLQIQNVTRTIETVFFNTSITITQQLYSIDTPEIKYGYSRDSVWIMYAQVDIKNQPPIQKRKKRRYTR